MTEHVAYLLGTRNNPYIEFTFNYGAKTARGTDLVKWVKQLPDRRWNQDTKSWTITGVGNRPDEAFAAAGIRVDFSRCEGTLAGVTTLSEVWSPLWQRSQAFPGEALIRPRLVGANALWERIGGGLVWDKKRERFSVMLMDLLDIHGNPKKRFALDPAGHAVAIAQRTRPNVPDNVRDAARQLAVHSGVDPDQQEQKHLSVDAQSLIDTVATHTGYIPDWFGLDLFPFQRCGVYAAAAGHSYLADEPGLGKTRQGLGVMALHGFERAVIVCPPLVLTNWGRETVAALAPGMTHIPVPPAPPVKLTKKGKVIKPRAIKKDAFPAWLQVIYPTAKVTELPDSGVVIVADSLLSSRPELLQELIAWGPTVMLADEVHRLKTWTTDRGVAVRRLATAVQARGGLSVPLTGTPLLASSPELANQLQISGHLGPIFGGASHYLEKFALRNQFGGWGSRKRAMPELNQLLYGHCWVRRNKAEVLKQLPKKWRVTRYVDVPTTLFTKAHEKLYETIGGWVKQMLEDGHELTDEVIKQYTSDNIGLISPMRVAAGVSKVPAAIDYINDWMESTTRTENGKKIYDRPLVVWTHHLDVMNALLEATPAGKWEYGIITGATPAAGRAAMADKYQAGEIGVLYASIQAAGFGITLTRGSDSLFVETDWTNASISQAEDRQWRIGQVNPVIATTLISRDTLDVSIRAVQRNKGELLNIVTPGGDNNVADASARLHVEGGVYEEIPEEEMDPAMPKNQFEIVERIVRDVVDQHGGQRQVRKAA
jgi:hypothetical protein